MIIGRHNGAFFFMDERVPSMLRLTKRNDLQAAFTRGNGYYIHMNPHTQHEHCITLPPEYYFVSKPDILESGTSIIVGLEITKAGVINVIYQHRPPKNKPVIYYRDRISQMNWEKDNFILDTSNITYAIYAQHEIDSLSARDLVQLIYDRLFQRMGDVANSVRCQVVEGKDMVTYLSDYYKDGSVPPIHTFNNFTLSGTKEVVKLGINNLALFNFEAFQHGTPNAT